MGWGEQDQETRLTGQEKHEIWSAINRLEEKQVATQAEVDQITTEVQTVATDLTTVQGTLQSEINSLAAANPGLDLSGLRTAVAPLAAAVQALGSLQPLTPAPAPTPEPTPTPAPEPTPTPTPEPPAPSA